MLIHPTRQTTVDAARRYQVLAQSAVKAGDHGLASKSLREAEGLYRAAGLTGLAAYCGRHAQAQAALRNG
jgi:hypothetical protein